VPTASYGVFSEYKKAAEFISTFPEGRQIVVKADGLAAGKGVVICSGRDEAKKTVKEILEDKLFGSAGKEVVVEEFLHGEEASIQIFLDGENFSIMAAAQDHKRVGDGDSGPNTGGMGAYAPAPVVDDRLKARVEAKSSSP